MTNTLPTFPSLVKALGWAEAGVLVQLDSWLGRPGVQMRDGTPWVYLTDEEWESQYPLRLVSDIWHILKRLERCGLVIFAHDDPDPVYQMRLYTINYEQVEATIPHHPVEEEVVS